MERERELDRELRGGKDSYFTPRGDVPYRYDFIDFHSETVDDEYGEEYPVLPRVAQPHSVGVYGGREDERHPGNTIFKRSLVVTFAIAVVVTAAAVIGAAVVQCRPVPANDVNVNVGGGGLSNASFDKGLGEELAQYTDEELLAITESITVTCNDEALETDEGRRRCIALCEGQFCCFDEEDEYGCVRDPKKMCLLYAGCEALVSSDLRLPMADMAWDVNGGTTARVNDGDEQHEHEHEHASGGPPPPPRRCTFRKDDGHHSEPHTEEWTDDYYDRCRSWEKKHDITIRDYWESFGVNS